MLGQSLEDPMKLESAAGEKVAGMKLLPMNTSFFGEKRRTRVTGKFLSLEGDLNELEGVAFEGYEIHMGESIDSSSQSVASMTEIVDEITKEASLDGRNKGNVYGTYVHGIFDSGEINQKLLSILTKKKGMEAMVSLEDAGMDYQAFKESQYDLLAGELRKHLDLEKIYEILEGRDS